jgi:hypothetical protein
MKDEDAKAFVERWRLVACAEREELRQQSLAEKFAQLSKLVDSARALGWETTDPAEVEAVRARWNRLVSVRRG